MSYEIFEQIGAASTTTGGNRIRQGKGRLIVEALKHFVSKQSGDNFPFEFFVKSSESVPGAVDRDTGQPELANAPGTTCSQVYQPRATPSAMGNIKSFIEALDGEQYSDPKAFASVLAAYVNENPSSGPVNPARGFEIRYETYQKQIRSGKNAGKMGTFVKWFHVEQSEADVAANRALLDGQPVSKIAAGAQARV